MEYADMTAVQALRAARAAGVAVSLKGEGLLLEATAEPPQAVLDALSRHKPDIVQLLRLDGVGWSLDDWRAFFEERAGIAEFDGKYPRIDAEINAFEECVDRWLALNPPTIHSPNTCLLCQKQTSAHDIDLARTVRISKEPAHLHPGCAARWKQFRRVEARTHLVFLLSRADMV
jgi:hypothetical protein